MPKLFVAIEMPGAVTAELARKRPDPPTGVRLVEPGQMHLTLHYVGEAETARIVEALLTVAVPAFDIAVEGIGQFVSADGTITLWAGVRESVGLLRLHAAIAEALAGAGVQPESRAYAPHVTLARCERDVQGSFVAQYMAQHKDGVSFRFAVSQFSLYSSTFIAGIPSYRRDRDFPLEGREAMPP